jgi:hydroxymethylpyrimidine pyrophosphatase-like HAD family hydrolase
MRIGAILSDYDGTLCATASLKSQDNKKSSSRIPTKLEKILWDISEKIDVCIVSSKDFGFLHSRIKFAKIASCVMGIETLVHKAHKMEPKIGENADDRKDDNDNNNNTTTIAILNFAEGHDDKLQCLLSTNLLSNKEILQHNSLLLDSLANEISLNFKDITIEKKFINDNKILAGVTIDYRHLKDWQSYKRETEPLLKEIIERKIRSSSTYQSVQQVPYVQTYSSHPFIDAYSIRCDKGLAFDTTISELKSFNNNKVQNMNILYLGDSENDNPAFKRADISIGVRSDKRLNPKLTCQYLVEFNQLSIFLKRLKDNDYVFSDELLLNLKS